jgi:hypothetical protein
MGRERTVASRSRVGAPRPAPDCLDKAFRDDEVGFWKLEASEKEWELKPDYLAALPQYLNGLDSIFARARMRDEAQLILSLLGVRGCRQRAGTL